MTHTQGETQLHIRTAEILTFALAPSHYRALTQSKMNGIGNPVYVCIFTVNELHPSVKHYGPNCPWR